MVLRLTPSVRCQVFAIFARKLATHSDCRLHVTKRSQHADDVSSAIPNVYRFLWSGSWFPRLYAVAISSVLAVDPNARVVVHCFGRRPASEAFDVATTDDRVRVVDTNPEAVFAELPAHLRRVGEVYRSLPPTAASARSNLLRYAILFLEGGFYVDFDTITLRPLGGLTDAPCFIGNERVWSLDERRVAGDRRVVRSAAGLAWLAIWVAKRADAAVFRGRLHLSRRTARLNRRFTTLQPNNAVIGAAAGSEFLDRVLRGTLAANPFVRYSTGPTLIARVARTSPHLVTVLSPEYFYQVEPAESFRYFTDVTLTLHPDAAVVHYVGSNSGRFLSNDTIPRRSVVARLTHGLDNVAPQFSDDLATVESPALTPRSVR